MAGRDKDSAVAVTITVVFQCPAATECDIQRFDIGHDSPEAVVMSNLPEELAKPLTGLVIAATDADRQGHVTTTIEAMIVEGLEPKTRFDMTVPVRELLAMLTQHKNRAVTLYFEPDGLKVVIYDMKDAMNSQSITLTAQYRDRGGGDGDGGDADALTLYQQTLRWTFTQCVFIHIGSLYEAVCQARPEDKVVIKVHQLTDGDGKVTRIVQIGTVPDSGGIEKSREFWMVASSENDSSSNCDTHSDDTDAEATQVIVDRHTKMMDMVKALENRADRDLSGDLVRANAARLESEMIAARNHLTFLRENRPHDTEQIRKQTLIASNAQAAFRQTNILHHTVRYGVNRDGCISIGSKVSRNNNHSYRKIVEASVQQRQLVRVLKPIVNTKRMVGLLFPDAPNYYMMMFVSLGGDSKILKFMTCLDDDDSS